MVVSQYALQVVSQHGLQQVYRGCAIPACIAGGIPACLATGLQEGSGPGGVWSQGGAWSWGVWSGPVGGAWCLVKIPPPERLLLRAVLECILVANRFTEHCAPLMTSNFIHKDLLIMTAI